MNNRQGPWPGNTECVPGKGCLVGVSAVHAQGLP